MATVIDSLIIELGLDSSKFMADQKKVIDALKEIQAENEKASKSSKEASKNKKSSSENKKAYDEEKKAGEESSEISKQSQINNKSRISGIVKLIETLKSLKEASVTSKEASVTSKDTGEDAKNKNDILSNIKNTSSENKKSADQDKKTNTEKKKAVQEDKKAGEESAKRAKESHLDSKKTADGYDKTKNAVLGLATAYFGLAGMKTLANIADTVAKETSARGRQATLLGVPEKDLQAWGAVGKTVGATEQDVTSSLQNIQTAMTAFATGGASKEAQVALGFLNIDRTRIDDFAYVAEKANAKIADLKKAGMKDTDAIQWVRQYTMDIGYNDATFQMLMRGPAKLQELHDEFVKLGHITPQLKAASDAYNDSTATLTQSLTGLYNVLSVGNLPFFTSIADGLSKAIEFSNVFVEKIRPIKSLLFSIGGNAIKSHIENVNKGLGTNIPTEWLDNKPIPVSPVLNNDISGPMVNGGTAEKNFSNIEKQNNLPSGTLSFLYQQESSGGKNLISPKGATGPFGFMPKTAAGEGLSREDTFDTGKSSQAAAHMMGRLLLKYKGNMDKALAGYNWGEGNVDEKGMGNLPEETRKYIDNYHNMIGSGANTPMNNGSSSQKTQNNNIVINSGSTDSRTLANEIPKAINTMTFISDGTQAVQ